MNKYTATLIFYFFLLITFSAFTQVPSKTNTRFRTDSARVSAQPVQPYKSGNIQTAEFNRSADATRQFAESLRNETSFPEADESSRSRDENYLTVAAQINVNGVNIILNKLVKFQPKGSIIYKTDNNLYDYYVMDITIVNGTNAPVNLGTEFSFNIDIETKEGESFQRKDPSVKSLTLYKMEIAKVDQASYDKMWGTLRPGETVRSILKGFQVPKSMKPFKLVYYNAGKKVRKEQNLK